MATRLVVGLDFGTTFSGVAFCDDVSAKEGMAGIQPIDSWPGTRNPNNPDEVHEKVPSRIAYHGSPMGIDMTWGYQIRPNTTAAVHACMKLALDRLRISLQFQELIGYLAHEIERVSLSAADVKPLPSYRGKDTVEIVADYLAMLWAHVLSQLSRVYGGALLHKIYKVLVVTVPAVWTDRAKQQTLDAIKKAKVFADETLIVTEPEAAAVYTLKCMAAGAQSDDVREGDSFVLADCGGGTVDLISYKITQLVPVLKIEEAAVGTGDKCGATYIDKNFLAWLEGWIGSAAYKSIPEHKKLSGSLLLDSFESSKRYFTGVEDDMRVTLPSECGINDDAELNIEDRVLSLTNAQMKGMFDPCVSRTLDLIDGQVKAWWRQARKAESECPTFSTSRQHRLTGDDRTKMVLVVGGFGKNTYLYNKIQDYCTSQGMSTRQPKFPWSAVALGAVCRGLEHNHNRIITSRLARRHYGLAGAVRFNADVHDLDDLFVNEYTGLTMAGNQMEWLVRKGEELPEDKPKSIVYDMYTYFNAGKEPKVDGMLIGCSDDVAPTRITDGKTYNICYVRGDLSNIPMSTLWETRLMTPITGEGYFRVKFQLQAAFADNEITWSLLYQGKPIGSTHVNYDV